MPIVRQFVELQALPEELFDAYLDPCTHAAITGGKVKISAKPNSRFSAFDGTLTGRTLSVVPKRLIVQSWRSTSWRAKDPDSILTLAFSQGRRSGGARIDVLHVDVPPHDLDGVTQGWRIYYWTPWRTYLKARHLRR
jgi:activator of HSP90 ATPase